MKEKSGMNSTEFSIFILLNLSFILKRNIPSRPISPKQNTHCVCSAEISINSYTYKYCIFDSTAQSSWMKYRRYILFKIWSVDYGTMKKESNMCVWIAPHLKVKVTPTTTTAAKMQFQKKKTEKLIARKSCLRNCYSETITFWNR